MPLGMRTGARTIQAQDEAAQVRDFLARKARKAGKAPKLPAADPCVVQLAVLGQRYHDLARARLGRMADKDPRVAPVTSDLDISAKSFNVAVNMMNDGNLEEAVRHATEGVFFARMAWERAR